MSNIKAVIFDLDGTLYNKRGLILRLIGGELGHLGLLIWERLVRRYLLGKAFRREDIAIWESNWYKHHFMPLMVWCLERHFTAREWVLPRLEQLRRDGVKTVVLSDYDCVTDKLKALGLDPALFDIVESSIDLGGLKPCKSMLMKVVDRLGVKPEEILIVGDRRDTDGASAHVLGAQFELVR